MYMTYEEIEATAKRLFAQHGLHDWTFIFNNTRRAIGMCNYTSKKISLTKKYAMAMTRAQIMNTLNHEIAHALAGYEAGHGPKWRAIAKQLGATPRATTSLTADPNFDMSRVTNPAINTKMPKKRTVKTKKVVKPSISSIDAEAMCVILDIVKTTTDLGEAYLAFYKRMEAKAGHRQIQLLFRKWWMQAGK